MEGIRKLFERNGLTMGRNFGKPSRYIKAFPEADACFNAQVFTEDGFCQNKEEIQSRKQHHYALWKGDLDMTFDNVALGNIATELGAILYITDQYGEVGWVIEGEEV